MAIKDGRVSGLRAQLCRRLDSDCGCSGGVFDMATRRHLPIGGDVSDFIARGQSFHSIQRKFHGAGIETTKSSLNGGAIVRQQSIDLRWRDFVKLNYDASATATTLATNLLN